jgi:putative endonuclease
VDFLPLYHTGSMIRRLSTEGPAVHIRISCRLRVPDPGLTLMPMTREARAVGEYGERLAARHLNDAGMVVLDRNWRCPHGEIDIVARDGDVLVFCEVKTRRGDGFGQPVDAVVATKVRRLRRLAAQWMATSGLCPAEIRFDVVSVLPQTRGAARVEHLRGAF